MLYGEKAYDYDIEMNLNTWGGCPGLGGKTGSGSHGSGSVDIVPVRSATLIEICTEKKLEISNPMNPTSSGMIGKDPKKNKIGSTIQLLGKDDSTGWGLYSILT